MTVNPKAIRYLLIENFQSHERTELSFDDGLNVIVGASDQGKSAIIRALRWLLYNEPRGSDFIRVGASQCRVTIELADGGRVTRERTPSKNRYIVRRPDGDEQVYEGFGNSVPLEVSEATGVAKVMLDEDTETALHIGTQLEPPFLLAEPGSIKAKAIGRLNGVHIMDAATRDTTRDLTRLSGEERNQREQLADVEAELEQFSDLPYLENILLLVESTQRRIKELHGLRQRLEVLRDRHQAVRQELLVAESILAQTEQLDRAALQVERAVMLNGKSLRLDQMRRKLADVGQGLGAAERVLSRTDRLTEAQERVDTGTQRLCVLQRLTRLLAEQRQNQAAFLRVEGVLERTKLLEETAAKVERIEQAKRKQGTLHLLLQKRQETQALLRRLDRVLERTQGIPAAGDALEMLEQKCRKAVWLHECQARKREIERQLRNIDKALSALDRTDRAEFQLDRLIALTERQKRLQQMHASLWDVGERLQKADAYLKANALDLTRMLDEYSRELKHSGTCPVCLTPIDEHTTERLLEEFKGGFPS
jgi:exonuclease SbcC